MRPGPSGADNRNLILAMVLIMALVFAYETFVLGPQRQARQREAAFRAEQAQQLQQQAPGAEAVTPDEPLSREVALGASQRAPFLGAGVAGSLNLTGARIDDLALLNYRERLSPESERVTLLSPLDAAYSADAVFGWEERNVDAPLAGASTPWRQLSEGPLTPENPLLLQAQPEPGLTITRRVELTDEFLFTITDELANTGDRPRSVRPYGLVRREGLPQGYRQNGIVHQGMIGVFGADQKILRDVKFERAQKLARDVAAGRRPSEEPILTETSRGGWLGLTDHYWLNAIIPSQEEPLTARFNARPDGADNFFIARYDGDYRELPAGGAISYTQRFFSGAKQNDLLQRYEEQLGVADFDKAIDWGNFWFLTRPLFGLLHWFYGLFGNYGLAIMAGTVVIKLLLFPLVSHSYKAMSKLRLIQPKMKEIQERYAADKQRQQQEMIALYQREKINPMAGCLPMLAPIPVFFALYKVLTVTIDLRHAPFFGWIQDLSAPDPTTIFNLFGLLPFDPTAVPVIGSVLALGVWPIFYGVTMWGTMALNPPPPDPVQARIFQFLPLVFTFIFAGFAAGLVIYWTWSNLLTMLQQYIIMRRNGVVTEFDKFLAKRLGRGGAAA